MSPTPPSEPTRFALRGRVSVITLEDGGLHHPTGARFGGPVHTAYSDITHIATSQRAVWIGTRRSVYVIGRNTFVDPHGPENLVRALLEQIAGQPGGSAQLARMAQIEEISGMYTPLRATWTLLIACVAIFAAQQLGGANVFAVGYFGTALTADGDWWRVVTANLLHAGVVHLIVNLVGLRFVGSLVELSLGTARTVCVMVVSGIGAMAASALWSEGPVVGVSGVLSGVFAALLWLELRWCEELPNWWRLPRWLLYVVLLLSVVGSLHPTVATAAHAGGFVAGGIAAALLTRRGVIARSDPLWVRATAVTGAAVTMLAIAAAGFELARPGEYEARYAVRLLRVPGITAEELNNHAWAIAIDERSSPQLLEAALELAERAADETHHAKAHILDTLAEVHFQLGDRDAAIEAIDEAILRKPDNDYYREQRRRFLGERDPEDRPFLPPEPAEPEVSEEDGLSV